MVMVEYRKYFNMYLEFKRKELDDQDEMRDFQRKMKWFFYLVCCYIHFVLFSNWIKLERPSQILGDMANISYQYLKCLKVSSELKAYSNKS